MSRGRRTMAEVKHFALEQTLQKLAVTSCVAIVLQANCGPLFSVRVETRYSDPALWALASRNDVEKLDVC